MRTLLVHSCFIGSPVLYIYIYTHKGTRIEWDSRGDEKRKNGRIFVKIRERILISDDLIIKKKKKILTKISQFQNQ